MKKIKSAILIGICFCCCRMPHKHPKDETIFSATGDVSTEDVCGPRFCEGKPVKP